MIALHGLYDNGTVTFVENAPSRKANVLVIFQEEPQTKTASESDMELFKKFSGSIKSSINERGELMEALDDKYAGSD